jgi:hypothetical protein
MPQEPVTPEMDSSRSRGPTPRLIAGLGVILVGVMLLAGSGRMELLAQTLFHRLAIPDMEAESDPVVEMNQAPDGGLFSFMDLDIHPDLVHRTYIVGSPLTRSSGETTYRFAEPFRQLLDIYEQRQAVDDNFTIRVLDARSGETIELFVLQEERARYDQTGSVEWGAIDRQRRAHTTRLVDKHVARGIPRADVMVRWGRLNQILEARENEAHLIEYEIRLANYLGLSLLSTEIGTVETFNNDRLVSPVGARGRYQMMPYLLRQNRISHYDLRAASGAVVRVFEEWHPLITMEPSFLLLRGYANAVGHEIPGISAYHTGPGNIFNLYRLYLGHEAAQVKSGSSVVDAYMWAVTDGFERVSATSSFKTHSRGYVPSAYGALRATQKLEIDTTQTIRVDRVHIRSGQSVFLSTLLDALGDAGAAMDWGPGTSGEMSVYERFRKMNPHIQLPRPADDGKVPANGDVRLVSAVNNSPVRFFLPVGATEKLAAAGINAIDDAQTFRFDQNTYTPDANGARTMWDRRYDELVADIRNWGFTRENRNRLNSLVRQFEELAREDPSHFRQAQLRIIKTHQMVWQAPQWQRLVEATEAALGRSRAPVRPPEQLEVTERRAAITR